MRAPLRRPACRAGRRRCSSCRRVPPGSCTSRPSLRVRARFAAAPSVRALTRSCSYRDRRQLAARAAHHPWRGAGLQAGVAEAQWPGSEAGRAVSNPHDTLRYVVVGDGVRRVYLTAPRCHCHAWSSAREFLAPCSGVVVNAHRRKHIFRAAQPLGRHGARHRVIQRVVKALARAGDALRALQKGGAPRRRALRQQKRGKCVSAASRGEAATYARGAAGAKTHRRGFPKWLLRQLLRVGWRRARPRRAGGAVCVRQARNANRRAARPRPARQGG